MKSITFGHPASLAMNALGMLPSSTLTFFTCRTSGVSCWLPLKPHAVYEHDTHTRMRINQAYFLNNPPVMVSVHPCHLAEIIWHMKELRNLVLVSMPNGWVAQQSPPLNAVADIVRDWWLYNKPLSADHLALLARYVQATSDTYLLRAFAALRKYMPDEIGLKRYRINLLPETYELHITEINHD